MLFSYQISDNKGKITKGKLEASNAQSARARLASYEGTLVSLTQIGKKGGKKRKGEITFGHVKTVDKVMFAKHLAVMIKAGMAIDSALETLSESSSAVLSKRIKEILEDVRGGQSLSSAIAKHPKDFDMLFVNMVAAGEKGGNLAENLNLLAEQQYKFYNLKKKIKGASIYPTVILFAVVGLTAVVSIYVLPKIVDFFSSLKMELPLNTRILIASSQFLVSYWMWIVGAIMGFVFLWKFLARFEKIRFLEHTIILKIPIVNKITKFMNLTLFARTLASLLNSGIPIDQSLQIVSKTVTNDVYKKQINHIYHQVLKGSPLSEALKHKKLFPKILERMSEVGEQSANLSEVLDYLADFYETEVDNMTKNLSNMIEPILLVGIGLVVGFVAMSIISPIYDLTSRVGG